MPQQKSTSVWDFKPWWCQPWSILLTGTTLIGGSWLLFEKIWLTSLVALPIGTWMGFFLLVYPQLALRSGLLDEMHQTQNVNAGEPKS